MAGPAHGNLRAKLIIKASVFSSCVLSCRPSPTWNWFNLYVYMFYFRFFFLSISRFLYSRVLRFDGLPGRALRRDSRCGGEKNSLPGSAALSLIPWGNSAERFPARSITFEVDLLLMTIATVFLYIRTCHPWLCVAAGGRWPSITVINVDGALDCVLCRPSVSSMSTLRWTLKILWPKKNHFFLPFSIVTE